MASVGFIFALATASLFVLVGASIAATTGVPEILKKNGLPPGLIPGTVKSYSITDDGKFRVELTSTCKAQISTEEVFYKKSITGQLNFGAITNVAGIQAHEVFWLSVTGVEVDKNDPGILWFHVGYLSKALDVDLFQVPPTCNGLSGEEDAKDGMNFSEWLTKALSGTLPSNVPNILNAGAARRMLL